MKGSGAQVTYSSDTLYLIAFLYLDKASLDIMVLTSERVYMVVSVLGPRLM